MIRMRGFKIKLIALLLLSFPFPACSDEISDANDAYNRGDYATAFKLIERLAVQGDLDAQYNLGYMCANGQGLSRDCEESIY